jgi:Peptidase family S41
MNRGARTALVTCAVSVLTAEVVCGGVNATSPGCPPSAQAASVAFDPQPWLADLQEARVAFSTRYAGLEWEVFGRDHDISATFAAARDRILHAHDEWEARVAFEKLVHRFGDKHVHISWPSPAGGNEPKSKGLSCEALGYTASMQQAEPLAVLLPGFTPISLPAGNPFSTGTLVRESKMIGIIKIPLFTARGFPSLCESAVEELHLDRAQPCDDACDEKIRVHAEGVMTVQLAAAIKAIQQAGAGTLIVDIAGNGGGSEWNGAASRMLTAVRLESMRNYFMRGALWTRHFISLEHDLQEAERKAQGNDRKILAHFVQLVGERKTDAETPCDAAPLWQGEHPACLWLGDAFFTTGLLSSADPQALRAKPWAALVFSPMQYPYHEGVWRGPLIVLVDAGTGSAAENFAADLQDNHAAVIVGAPTVGAGCGHTDERAPIKLSHTGGVLDLPDCVRIRLNGLNLSSGVQPDILVGLRAEDSLRRRASLLDQKLDEALLRASRLEGARQASP